MQDGKARFVARITIVKGIPFYGFHVGYRYYLKIYVLNPMVMTRLGDLLRQGAVMKKVFQPYEVHLQYLLQWMADYNLYGCGYIDAKKVTFRDPVPSYVELKNTTHLWHDLSISPDNVSDGTELQRVSHCSLEVDICVQDIINRQEVKSRPLHHDFVERLNPLAPDEKLVYSMAGLWRDETRRRKSRMMGSDAGSSPFPAEVMVSMTADLRNSQAGGWIHEKEYREMIADLIQDERVNSDASKIGFNSFVKKAPFESAVRTTLESVEDLYPENLHPALGIGPITSTLRAVNYDVGDDFDTYAEREVNKKKILGLDGSDDEDFPYDSDEDIMRKVVLSQKEPKGGQLAVKGEGISNLRSNDVQSINSSSEGISGLSVDGRLGNGVTADSIISKRATSTENSFTPSPKRQKFVVEHKDVPISSPFYSKHKITETENGLLSDDIKPAANVQGRSQTFSQKSYDRLSPLKAGSRPSQPVLFPENNVSGHRAKNVSQTRKSNKTPSQTKRVSFQPSAMFSSSPSKLSPLTSRHSATIIPQSSAFHPLVKKFSRYSDSPCLVLGVPPPSAKEVTSTMLSNNLPTMIYQGAYYSNEVDVPERAREWAGREFKLESVTLPFLPEFDATGTSSATFGERPAIIVDRVREEHVTKQRQRACHIRSWQIAGPPPSYREVKSWAHAEQTVKSVLVSKSPLKPKANGKLSQIDGPTQKNRNGIKYTQPQKKTSVKHQAQYMSTMSLEVHINTRGSLVPNPEEDEIQCVFWCLHGEDEVLDSNGPMDNTHIGVVVLNEGGEGDVNERIAKEVPYPVQQEDSELDLLIRMVDIVRMHDPDILTGYEVHGGSWGYLIERARLKYDYNLCDEFSRMKSQSHGRFGKENDKWGFNNTSTIRVTGRHMINIWRAMRGELNLLQYTMENVAFHLLHKRIPHYPWSDLTKWYTSGKARDLAKVIRHYTNRVQLDVELLEKNELIPRTSEQARLLGVDFFSVFSRGSQYKVESLMFRIAKPENFLLVSPSRKQVGGQNALECLPLVMEPQSAFYNSPLLVLDFQSLYPSVMIAYNYCYSTFLGRIVNWRGTNKMGFAEYKRQQRLLELLKDHINISPNGMMYTKPEIRKSLLAKMLGEILETRVMVKSGMKVDKDDTSLQRLLNNRQLALKLIANVTYGYTSASFSGRMPCSEIADSIVQTGRETLEKAIALIHSVKRWGAEVVYGDTDSLFVYLKGRTKDQAFDIGEEIAKTITNMNPRPVKLKFEKVYFPCVLLAKKRYVGFKYEHRNQKVPDFDAKGIETVRRDGTPAEQKIEEKALKLLFRTADLSQVKAYFQEQCEKIMRGSVSVQDFCFAREVKLGTYSDKGPPPPGALISTKRMLEDARAEPQYGERVPYVVITGAPGARLIDRCVAPEELLDNDHSELDSEYYISKNLIPPLERIFNLVGANVRSWYDEMPKYQRIRKVDLSLKPQQGQIKDIGKKTLESYMKSLSCLVCNEKLEEEGSVCPKCSADKPVSILALRSRLSLEEEKYMNLLGVCQSCSGITPLDEVKCDSKDCPVFYTRTRQRARLKNERAVSSSVIEELTRDVEEVDIDW